jgi:hypothetical protein
MMVVAEHGALWAPWADRAREEYRDVVVLSQGEAEPIEAFADRVRERVQALANANEAPTRAVVVGGGRTDQRALQARSTLVRSIAVRMGTAGGGFVRLIDAGRDRFSMAAIAATVSMFSKGTRVRVEHAAPMPALAA